METSFCEKGQPIMDANTAAEIYFKRADILDKGIYMINKVGNNMYLFSHKDDFKNGRVSADARACIFMNKETGECMLGKERPKTCGNENSIMPTVTKDILKVGFEKGELKKRMKRQKEDMILYLSIAYLNKYIDKLEDGGTDLGGVFDVSYTYKLVLTKAGVINSIRYTKLTAKDKKYEPAAKIYNTVSRNMLVVDQDYLTLTVKKLNSFLKAGNFETCDVELNEIERTAVYTIALFRLYMTEYKSKSKEFTGITEVIKTYRFLKEVNQDLRNGEEGSLFSREKIECILKNTRQIFNIIMKNK